MSLQVWLPLTKDLRQQGLSKVTVTNNGATFSSAGKLGGCYEFASGKRIQTTLPTSTNLKPKAISFACWMYVTSWNSSYDCFMSIADGTGWNQSRATLCRNNTASTLTWNIADGSNRAYVTTTSALPLNTWTHVAGTYDGTNLKIYINGVLNNTAASTLSINYAGTFNIGGWSGANYPFNGKLNDVRFYNHCLSSMEIKELARGLVLHYPLNRGGWGQENLVWNTHWDNMPTSWSNWGSPPTREIVNINGKRWLHVKSSDRWQGYSQNQSNRSGVGEITAGEKLTLSCYAYSTTSLTNYPPIGIHWTDGSSIISQSWPQCNLTTTPQKFVTTLTVPNGVSAFNIMVGNGSGTVNGVYEVWISEVKIERGEIATPWCPNSSDTLATTMGLNSTTEYDCSGFCNNGTRTGTFTWTSDTPKYQVSSKIAAASTGIKTSNFYIGDVWSMSVWFKYPSQDSSGWKALVILNNNGGDADLQFGNYINCNSNTIQYSANGKYTTGVTFTYGEWHHIVNTYDGTTLKCYLDGVYKTSVTPGQTLSRSNLGIGFKSSSVDFSSVGSSFTNGFLSDVRIYATALSADDVKSLYQNEAFIDSSGTIYGQIR